MLHMPFTHPSLNFYLGELLLLLRTPSSPPPLPSGCCPRTRLPAFLSSTPIPRSSCPFTSLLSVPGNAASADASFCPFSLSLLLQLFLHPLYPAPAPHVTSKAASRLQAIIYREIIYHSQQNHPFSKEVVCCMSALIAVLRIPLLSQEAFSDAEPQAVSSISGLKQSKSNMQKWMFKCTMLPV